jgi:hypothetical protein
VVGGDEGDVVEASFECTDYAGAEAFPAEPVGEAPLGDAELREGIFEREALEKKIAELTTVICCMHDSP